MTDSDAEIVPTYAPGTKVRIVSASHGVFNGKLTKHNVQTGKYTVEYEGSDASDSSKDSAQVQRGVKKHAAWI